MALPSLATPDDILARLGRGFTERESSRVSALLRDASASVRGYTHQTISEVVGDAVRLRVHGGRVRLPQRPVTSITSVAPIAGGPVYFYWEGFDTLNAQPTGLDTFGWEPFHNGIVAVNVVYTHGYNPIPDDIVGVVCAKVARSLGREFADGGLQSERFEEYSYTVGSAGAAGAYGLLPDEREILDGYRRVGGSVQVGP